MRVQRWILSLAQRAPHRGRPSKSPWTRHSTTNYWPFGFLRMRWRGSSDEWGTWEGNWSITMSFLPVISLLSDERNKSCTPGFCISTNSLFVFSKALSRSLLKSQRVFETPMNQTMSRTSYTWNQSKSSWGFDLSKWSVLVDPTAADKGGYQTSDSMTLLVWQSSLCPRRCATSPRHTCLSSCSILGRC